MVEKYDTPEAQTASKGTVDDGVKFVEQQGRTSKDIQAYIQDLHQNHPDQYRATIDAVYNRVHTDAGSNPNLNGLLPQIDLIDSTVDAQGAAGDRANFSGQGAVPGVTTNERGEATAYTAPDGKTGMAVDGKGQLTAYEPGENNGIKVTSTAKDGSVTTFNHTDIDPASVKLQPNGDLTMTRKPTDGQTGTVTVHPGGSETTVLTKDGTTTTIERTRAGGDVTKYNNGKTGAEGINYDATTTPPTFIGGPPGTKPDLTKPIQVGSDGSINYTSANPDVLPGGTVTLKPDGTSTVKKDNVTLTIGKDGKPTHYNFTDAQGHKIDSDINPDGSLKGHEGLSEFENHGNDWIHDYREYGLNLQTGQLNYTIDRRASHNKRITLSSNGVFTDSEA